MVKFTLVFTFIFAVFFSYAGCHDSNGSGSNGGNGGDVNAFTPVVLSVLAPPVPVKGSDGMYHFVYELVLSNSNTFNWEILSVEVLDGDENGNVIHSFSGEEVINKMQQIGTRIPVNMLEPAQSGLVYMAFEVDGIENVPEMLTHRLTVTVPGGLPERIVSFLQLPPGQDEITEIGARVEVSDQDVLVLGPPLEGTGWVAVNGCCDSITHVRSDLAVNGEIHISQRFAIDWMKVNEDDRLYVGDPQNLKSWFGYEENVLAVAEGLVVTVVDKFEDQIPFTLPTDTGAITLEQIDGNHVILALGNGQFAFYAHLKPGSIQVKEGDFVTRGQVLGLLGNTGNTSAPHMHFHIMETNSSLGSNGLPYTYDQFNLVGRTTDESFFDMGLEDNTPFVDEETGLIIGNTIDVLPVPNPGIHNDELPLNLRVVDFPDGLN